MFCGRPDRFTKSVRSAPHDFLLYSAINPLLPRLPLTAKIYGMRNKSARQRSLFSWPQALVLLLVLAALFVAMDLNQRAEAGRQVGAGQESLQHQVNLELTRQVELEATRAYVESEDFVSAYARDEAGQVLPGERRVVPLYIEVTPTPGPPPSPTPDPAASAQPWQAWWSLLTDAPQPHR